LPLCSQRSRRQELGVQVRGQLSLHAVCVSGGIMCTRYLHADWKLAECASFLPHFCMESSVQAIGSCLGTSTAGTSSHFIRSLPCCQRVSRYDRDLAIRTRRSPEVVRHDSTQPHVKEGYIPCDSAALLRCFTLTAASCSACHPYQTAIQHAHAPHYSP
jgi:hypothetical protein